MPFAFPVTCCQTAARETLAHVNTMLRCGEPAWAEGTDGVERVATRG
jgi:hypothetical protein